MNNKHSIHTDRNAGLRLVLFIILTCLIIGITGHFAKAQSLQITSSDTTFYTFEFDTTNLTYKFPDYSSQRIGESTITKPVERDMEIFHAIPVLLHNRSAIMQYLINALMELMEPCETITIKKVKE